MDSGIIIAVVAGSRGSGVLIFGISRIREETARRDIEERCGVIPRSMGAAGRV